jgi:hypothetical protein
MAMLKKTKTWITVPQPPNKNIVSSKWVYHIKHGPEGQIIKYKAQLVAKGYVQIYSINYYNTFSPIMWLASLHTILVYAACHNWKIESFDFNGVYLNRILMEDEEVYMQELPTYKMSGEGTYVKKLQKTLYGLNQLGHKWYDILQHLLADLGFQCSNADPGMFYAHIGIHLLILVTHVNDCTLTGSSAKLVKLYKQKFNECYALTNFGPIHWVLGIKVMCDCTACTISLSQTAYIESILKHFNLGDTKPLSMPMTPGIVYSKQDSPSHPNEVMHMSTLPYREAIGSLMYASVAMHPNITFTVTLLSQFLSNPGEAHWEGAKHILHYLSGTKSLTLTYGIEHYDLEGYTDADSTT